MAKHVKKYHLSLVATEAHSPDRGAVSIPFVHEVRCTTSYGFVAFSDSGLAKTKKR